MSGFVVFKNFERCCLHSPHLHRSPMLWGLLIFMPMKMRVTSLLISANDQWFCEYYETLFYALKKLEINNSRTLMIARSKKFA